MVGEVPKQTEELAIEGELTRDGVDWEYEEVGEVARGKKNEIELKRVEKEEWESEKKSWEQEKVKKKNGTKCSRGFLFFFFFFVVFFLIVLKNNKLALRKLKTTIFFIK